MLDEKFETLVNGLTLYLSWVDPMNTRHKLHWQRDFVALRRLPLEPCLITSCVVHMRCVGPLTGFDSAPPSCHLSLCTSVCVVQLAITAVL